MLCSRCTAATRSARGFRSGGARRSGLRTALTCTSLELSALGKHGRTPPGARRRAGSVERFGATALGRIEAALGEHEAAIAAYRRALELGPETAAPASPWDSLLTLGRFDEAITHYRQAIATDPGDDDARVGAGAALVELGRTSEAMIYLEHAVESQPNPRYLAHFGDALWQLGEHASAIDALTAAVRVAPDWPGATSRLTWMLAVSPDPERRDPERAQRIAQAALAQLGAPDAALQDALAAALAAAGRFDEARAEAERAAEHGVRRRRCGAGRGNPRARRGYARREVWREPPRLSMRARVEGDCGRRMNDARRRCFCGFVATECMERTSRRRTATAPNLPSHDRGAFVTGSRFPSPS